MLVGAAACTTKSGADKTADEKPADGPVKGGTLSFYIAEPAFIDPYDGQESEGVQVINALYDSLADFDPKTSELVPAVAESWESNDDGTVWTFKLRKGVKFHNGREVTAADFKYAWERIVDPANKSTISYHLSAIKGYDDMVAGKAKGLSGVVVKGDSTLEVTLSYPFGDFEYVVGHPSLGPVPKEEVDKDPKAFLDMPVGNGPFKMAEPWKHEQYIKLVRNDDYYGDEPHLDGVDFMIFKDEETAFTEFTAGNLDFTSIPTGRIKETIQQYGESEDGYTIDEGGGRVLLGSELATYYICINTKDDFLKNVDVRRAISLAINREAIAEEVYEGTRVPATGAVPEGIVGFQENAWEYNRYDLDEARELLAKAGYQDGKGAPEITLSFNSGVGHEDVMALVQADLNKLGIKSKFDGHEWGEYTDAFINVEDGRFTAKGTHHLVRLGWGTDYPIMDNFLYPLFSSDSGDNKALYQNADIDRALLEARKTTDAEERTAKYREIERKIGADQPLIAVVNYRHLRVGSQRLRGFVFSPVGLASLGKAWLAGGVK